MHDVGVISVRAMKSEHTSNDNSKILKLLTKQQEMLDKQQKQIDRLSKARKYSSTISSNTYSSHKSESNINYQVTCYKCGGKGHTRPECPSPFQAQRSDEDAQKPHTSCCFVRSFNILELSFDVCSDFIARTLITPTSCICNFTFQLCVLSFTQSSTSCLNSRKKICVRNRIVLFLFSIVVL
jgi:hypothetical protein